MIDRNQCGKSTKNASLRSTGGMDEIREHDYGTRADRTKTFRHCANGRLEAHKFQTSARHCCDGIGALRIACGSRQICRSAGLDTVVYRR